jgi:DNA-binding LacI/PurR family transcriptional regulator
VHVASIGHRRVAYISPLHASRWSVERLAGLTAACARAGGATVPFVLPAYRYAYESMERSDRNAMARWLREVFRGAIRQVPGRDQRLAATLRELGMQATSRLQAAAFRHLCRPLFAAAAADAAVTAWVCANDDVAVEAAAYLGSAGRRVPQDVSVAGFDDGASAFERRVTSYNFNAAAAVHAMLRQVLGSPSLLGRACRHICAVDGFVVERQSTARRAAQGGQPELPV